VAAHSATRTRACSSVGAVLASATAREVPTVRKLLAAVATAEEKNTWHPAASMRSRSSVKS
jgi:hypothetical protein